MLPSRSGILAEAINTKILTKNHPNSPHLQPYSHILTLIPRIPILIPCVLNLIPRIPIIPLIPLPDSPFRFLQIAFLITLEMKFRSNI